MTPKFKLKLTAAAVEAAYCSQMALHSGTIRKVLEAALPHIEVEIVEQEPDAPSDEMSQERDYSDPRWDGPV